jgi:hypothetical protein
MNHPIRCSCGVLKGTVSKTDLVNRCVCYCTDCQAFAHFLKRNTEILDGLGGTDIIQTLPKYISFTEGTENLACMRLTENGLLRWYASCCNTPIGNTHPNFKTSFVGLIHTCLEAGEGSLDGSFGPIRMHVHTKHAKAEGKVKSVGVAAAILRLTGMILRARFDGSYKITPFFVTETGAPIVSPKVLSVQELKEVKSAV